MEKQTQNPQLPQNALSSSILNGKAKIEFLKWFKKQNLELTIKFEEYNNKPNKKARNLSDTIHNSIIKNWLETIGFSISIYLVNDEDEIDNFWRWEIIRKNGGRNFGGQKTSFLAEIESLKYAINYFNEWFS